MEILEEIEQKFNFTYPVLYKQLYADGMLDTGEYGPHWHEIYFPKLKVNPPLLLFGHDFELLKFNTIVEEIEAFRATADYRQTKSEYQFIPFGQNAGGDLYVFQFDIQNDDDVPITLVDDGACEATILAKNLQDFIFRQLLEVVSEIDEYSIIIEAVGSKTNAFNTLRTHSPYLTQRQIDKLTEVYNREIFEYK
jgi:hypothetical protein